MNFPVCRKEFINIVLCEKIRCPVRAVDHTKLPFIADIRQQVAGGFDWLNGGVTFGQMQYITGQKCPAVMPAKLTERKGRARA